MKLFIVFSGDESQETSIPRAYTRTWDDSFAQRVLMHLTNDVNLCTGCAEFCEHCRDQYPIQFAQPVQRLTSFVRCISTLWAKESSQVLVYARGMEVS